MSDDDLRIGDPAPPLVPGPSLEAEERAMRGGRGGLVAILGGIVLLIGGGLAFFVLQSGDANEAYETLGRNVNGLKARHFDAFWTCAFQGEKDLRNNEELAVEIHSRSERGHAAYARMVRERCLDRLEQLEPRLRDLIPPDDMVSGVNELIAATELLRGAWSDYLAYLEGLEGAYDRELASERVAPIARCWYEYRRAHGALNQAIREKLE